MNAVALLPEMILLATAVIAMFGDLFMTSWNKHITCYVAQVGLLLATVVVVGQLGHDGELAAYGMVFCSDAVLILKCFIYITAFFSFGYATQYLKDKGIAFGEFYMLGLFSVLGMSFMVASRNLVGAYMALETMSLPLYAMIALQRDRSLATESSLKYFTMGAVASAFLLYGMSLVYGATGSLDLTVISHQLLTEIATKKVLLDVALVFVVVAACFKLAVVPFHMWLPDVYQGAPNAVVCFVSGAPKIAAVGLLYQLVSFGFSSMAHQWQLLLLCFGLLSVCLGNVFAVVQTSIKRLFGYSAIAHMGYLLLAMALGNAEGNAAAFYYAVTYGITAVAGFGLLTLMSQLGLEIEAIDDLKGLNSRNSWLAFVMMLVLLSMGGIPPLVGFFAKLLVFNGLIQAGWLYTAVFALVMAVVGGYNYLRVTRAMYFDAADSPTYLKLRSQQQLLFSINALALLLFGLFPNALMQSCLQAFPH